MKVEISSYLFFNPIINLVISQAKMAITNSNYFQTTSSFKGNF